MIYAITKTRDPLKRLTDQDGNTTSWTYNSQNKMVQQDVPGRDVPGTAYRTNEACE